MKYVREDNKELVTIVSEPRTRSEDDRQFPALYRSWWYDNRVGVTQPAEPAKVCNLATGTLRTMSDFVTPGFKKASSRGTIVNSPMSSTRVTLQIAASSGCAFKNVQTTVTPPVTWVGDITGPCVSAMNRVTSDALDKYGSSLPGIITSEKRSQMIGLASTAARSKIVAPSFTGLVSIGELRETLSYLRNPFKAGIKLASLLERDLKMANTSKRSGSTMSAIASVYLEFRYAVRPMLYEIERAMDTVISQTLKLDPLRKTVRAKQEAEEQSQTVYPASFSGLTYDETRLLKHNLSVRCGFLYEELDGIDLNDRWGMRVSDIPAAMWELTPLSFVYDWVGNMGEFISAITPVAGIRHLSSWTTIVDHKTMTLSGSNYVFPLPGWVTTRNGPNIVTVECVTKSRYPMVNAPSLEWRGLDKLANDPLKLLDLIGIFKQKLDPLVRKHNAFEAEVKRATRFSKRINSF